MIFIIGSLLVEGAEGAVMVTSSTTVLVTISMRVEVEYTKYLEL